MNDTHFACVSPLTVTDPLGNVTVNAYDGLNRLLTTVHDADTALVATETNGYNDLNKVSYEDAEGRVI